jgi:hypothetical protein
MTDEESPTTDSRRERLVTRRRRTRAVGVVVAIAMIALAIGTAMALHDRDDTSAATPGRSPRADTSDSVTRPSIAPVRRLGPPRAISHSDPLRLWIAGDSLAGSFGPALGQTAGATGVVDATIDYKVSSGLADQGIRDWPDHAVQEMSSSDPDAIVFIIGTNDASIVNSYDGNADGVHDWEVKYRDRIDRMMTTFAGGSRHRTVYWLGPPTMGDQSLNKGGYELGRVMREEARKFARDVVYVDTYRLFSDENGDYSRSLPDADGETVTMRISDGIHFSVAGAKYLADTIWKLLDTRWHITRQADPSQPIDYTIAQGSNDYVPGVGRYRPTVPSSPSSTAPASSVPTTTAAASTTTKPAPTTTRPVSTTTAPVPPTTKPVPPTTIKQKAALPTP